LSVYARGPYLWLGLVRDPVYVKYRELGLLFQEGGALPANVDKQALEKIQALGTVYKKLPGGRFPDTGHHLGLVNRVASFNRGDTLPKKRGGLFQLLYRCARRYVHERKIDQFFTAKSLQEFLLLGR